jgi:putative flippase GtrA
MKRAAELVRHPITGQALRFGIAGGTVTLVNLAIPIVLNDALGIPIEVVIPFAYIVAASLQFTLQRMFVFRHVEQFALSTRAQLMRYVLIGAVQYPTVALGTFALPKLFDISSKAAFLGTSLTFSFCLFLFMRKRVFHPADTPDQETDEKYDKGQCADPAALPSPGESPARALL